MKKIQKKLCALLLVAVLIVVAMLPIPSVAAAGTSSTKITVTTIWKYQLKAYNESLDLYNMIKKDGWRISYQKEIQYDDYCRFTTTFAKGSGSQQTTFTITQYVYPKKASRFIFAPINGTPQTDLMSLKAATAYYKSSKFKTEKQPSAPVKTPAVVLKIQKRAYEGAKKVSAALEAQGWTIVGYSCWFSNNVFRTDLLLRRTVKGVEQTTTIQQITYYDSACRFDFADKEGNNKHSTASVTIKYINNNNISWY